MLEVWTPRILGFPVRTAAVDAFLCELKAKGSGDLNGVLTTLNDGELCRTVLRHWLSKEWIVVAPHSPLLALAGPGFSREVTLQMFCGEEREEEPETELSGSEQTGSETEEAKSDEDQ